MSCNEFENEMKGRKEMKIKVMLDPGAKMPTRAHEDDAGMDLYSREEKWIVAGHGAVFDTGVHVEIPKNFTGLIKSKSGLNIKYGVVSDGVIDAGYTGSIVVRLQNNGEKHCLIKKGDKITQLVLVPIITPDLELVDSLEETERGNNGFGSSGR